MKTGGYKQKGATNCVTPKKPAKDKNETKRQGNLEI
ncbi:hypothetical protein HCH_04622 [Hahella chejuensis KCTC 2396]|uniref:Uncharacterized protein n=1 Tax=Hahella chejuensis (strain KCTC 2396) TaxID=349521 RepID=Q2SDF2_HAHCH|nr:hypothetical protein HCH_04622 [Hahella chejuensis KCTC 2396]